MQCNITTSLIVSLSESGFGLDELVYRMEDLANQKAFPELLKTIILVVDENLRLTVMLKKPLPAKCGWEEYWRNRMELNQSVMLSFRILEVR